MLNRRAFLTRLIGSLSVTAFGPMTLLRQAWARVLPGTLAADPRRPQIHLLPAANWMNDPNGPIYWKGNYHMFYQYNPNGAYWGDMHWGHAVSPDMVHWRHLPVALAPTPGGPDSAGCFSGTAVVHGDRVALLYTGVVAASENEATIRDGEHSLRESQCLAFSTDRDLNAWTKEPLPVIPTPPPGMDVSGFRDPSPWRHGDWWYMVVGSGFRGKGGTMLLYRSKDLRHWDYLHLLSQGAGNGKSTANPVDSGDMWECPDFFPLGDKYVLIHSAEGKSFWQAGIFDAKELVFHPEQSGVLDYGSFYAPKTQLDANQNRILWGWISEKRPLEEYRASGWAGMMSLPRILTLDRDENLCMMVSPEVDKLRRSPQTLILSDKEESIRQQLARMRISDGCGEILCSVKAASGEFHVSIVGDGEATQWLNVKYTAARPGEITLDEKTVPLRSDNINEIELHFYIDGSVMEAFVNRQIAYTKRFYYPGSSAPPVGIRISDKTNFSSLTMWQLSPISSNRLTT